TRPPTPGRSALSSATAVMTFWSATARRTIACWTGSSRRLGIRPLDADDFGAQADACIAPRLVTRHVGDEARRTVRGRGAVSEADRRTVCSSSGGKAIGGGILHAGGDLVLRQAIDRAENGGLVDLEVDECPVHVRHGQVDALNGSACHEK